MSEKENKTYSQELNVRQAVLVGQNIAVNSLLFVALGVYLVIQSGTWHGFVIIALAAQAVVGGFIATDMFRRDQQIIGGWVLLLTDLIAPAFASLVVDNLGYVAFAYIMLSAYFIVSYAFVREKRIAATVVTLVSLVMPVTAEIAAPAWRVVSSLVLTAAPVFTAVLGTVLLVIVVRQFWWIVDRSLRLRITVWTGAIVVFLSIILISYSVITLRQAAVETAEDNALQQAASQAGYIRAEAEIPLDTARALAQAFTAVKDPSADLPISRSQVNGMLRQVLIENPSFLGTYTLWEPNAFDGQDELYRGTEVHDETGRFIPYWVRDGESISVIPLEQYETPGIGDWYLLPRQTKKEVTVAPLVYPIQGEDTVMASFVVPIVYNGQFYGIAGVDAPISFTQDIVDSVDLYNGKAGVVLLTGEGTLISVRNRPELVNQPATEIYNDFSDLQARIEAGEAFISPSADGQYLRVFAPVDLGKTGSHWSFSLIIPVSEITAEATRAAFVQAGIGLVAILLALYALWFLTGRVVRPLQALTSVASQISQGNLEAIADIRSEDETGILANTFNSMVNQLRELLESLERRVAERTSSLELAATVGRTISQVSDLDSMLRQATKLILEQFDLYYVQVYLTDPGQTTLKLEAGTGEVGVQLLARNHSLPLSTASINGRAAVEKRAVVISDTAESLTFRPNPLLPETRGEMALPLIVGEKVVGVLDLQTRNPGKLTEELVPAYEALAGQLAVAIQNASLLAEAEQARAEVEAQARRQVRTSWNEHLDAIHKPEQMGYLFDRNQVLPLDEASELPDDSQAVSAPISLTGEEFGSLIVEIDEERREQTSELVTIVARQVAQHIENLRLLESAERYRREAEQAIRRQTKEGWQEYIRTKSGESLGYLYDLNEVRPYNNGQNNPSALTLPLKVRDEAVGMLAVEGLTEEDKEAVELMNLVAERLGNHIESLRLTQQIQLRAHREQALRQITNAVRSSTNLATIMRTTVRELGTVMGRRAVIRMAVPDQPGGENPLSEENRSSENADGGMNL